MSRILTAAGIVFAAVLFIVLFTAMNIYLFGVCDLAYVNF